VRAVQPKGERGSLKWIQRLVALDRNDWLPAKLTGTTWVSPLADDQWAEYRDTAFLKRVGQSNLSEKLADFWPSRGGPQWDALGLLDGAPVLVEAKAHVREFHSPGTQAKSASRAKIDRAFRRASKAFGAAKSDHWADVYYQYANRLAHLWFFHEHGVKAHLLFVSFLDDDEMAGPRHAETWEAAFAAADYALGIRKTSLMSKFVHHATPSVRGLE